MSRNGSGTYNLPAGNPVVTGTVISSTWANNTFTDVASALTGSVAADGQTPMTGDLDMNTNKIINLEDPVNLQDAATKAYVISVIPDTTPFLLKASNLSDVTNASTSRTNLGLGSIATQAASAVAVTGGAIDGTTIGTTTRSSVKATTLDLGLSTQSVAIGQGNASIMKNRIINGSMVISQRKGTSSFTPANGDYTVDRWVYQAYQAGKVTCQQNAGAVTPPVGFSNYLGYTSTSAYTVGASEAFWTSQRIEGFNFADCNWGTANAKTVTLSFWVRSSLTGTFGGGLQNAAQTRSYPFNYTISVANTWEQKSVTIAGDTSGTWIGATNEIGVNLDFSLGAGSTFSATAGAWTAGQYYSATGATSVVGTNGATFYITGVQLEVGSSATGYEYRLYNQELNACQRYFYWNGGTNDATFFYYNPQFQLGSFRFPVTMRSVPTVTIYNTTTANECIQVASSTVAITGVGNTSNTGYGSFQSSNAFGGPPVQFNSYISAEL